MQRKRAEAATTRAFLFSDLRDYTSFVEAKGDAAAARLLRDYRTLVRREVARHDGAEVKTEGDSFYVVFDAPSVALDCAVAILRAADVRNGRDPTSPLRIGVGLHAGETIAYDDQFVGSAVNIASRLAGKADAGELLISDTLRGVVRTSRSIAMSERGPLELKGVAEAIRAWTVDWRPPLADLVEREIRNDTALAVGNRHSVVAARALLAGDAAASARELEAAYPHYERVGFAGLFFDLVLSFVLATSPHGIALGDEWRPVAMRMRSFAERAGAKRWLDVLEKARLHPAVRSGSRARTSCGQRPRTAAAMPSASSP